MVIPLGGYGQHHWVCLFHRRKFQISSNTNYLQENIKELKAFEIKLVIQHSRVKSNRASITAWTLCQKYRYYYLQKRRKKKRVQYFIAWNWNFLTIVNIAIKNIFHSVIEETEFLSQHFTKAFVNEVLCL